MRFTFLLLIFTSPMVMAQLEVVNSIYDEQAPIFSPSGNEFYFTRANHPENRSGKRDPGDIWVSFRQGSTWSVPVPLVQLNNSAYNAVIGFSYSGNEIFLIGHYKSGGEAANSQGISVSRKIPSGWSKPENISIPYFINRSIGTGAFVPASGEVCVYSATAPGSIGNEDIFVSLKKDGQWGEPQNLGESINSGFQDLSPSLSPDGKTLYFSSNRNGSFGSFDVYSSTRLDESWTNWSIPENIGIQVNSDGRELFYNLSGLTAYYTSTKNSDGYGDIKAHFLKDSLPESGVTATTPEEIKKQNTIRVFGKVVSSKDGHPVSAQLSLHSNAYFQTTSDNEGSYSIEVDKEKLYTIQVESKGFIGSLERIDLRSYSLHELEINFKLKPVEIGISVKLGNVLFRQSTSELLEESFDELDMVAEFLKVNPSVVIELSGHTDNRGKRSLNQILSTDRVKKVKSYLVSKGIDGDRIIGKGYGGTVPVADNRTEEGRRLNRRVEFKIIR